MSGKKFKFFCRKIKRQHVTDIKAFSYTKMIFRVQLRFLTLAVFVSQGILKCEYLPYDEPVVIPIEKLQVSVDFYGYRNAACLSPPSLQLRRGEFCVSRKINVHED